jgi:DegV family protein with EDD domain
MKTKVRIVTDTVASLPDSYTTAHVLEVIPQVVLFGEESYLEGRTIAYPDFIQRLKSSPQLPKTAAPPPGLMIQAYQRQLAEAETILSIHPSSDVSGTVRSAEIAKESFPGADIRILDTRTAGGNLATMVKLAVEWAEKGVEADEIMRRLEGIIPRLRTYILVSTLEYLQKGGRIGGASALVGSILQIKPILEFKNGRIEPLEKVRTHAHAYERLIELVVENCPPTADAHVCVMHTDDPAEALRLEMDLRARLRVGSVSSYILGASITTHIGPGALGVGFIA